MKYHHEKGFVLHRWHFFVSSSFHGEVFCRRTQKPPYPFHPPILSLYQLQTHLSLYRTFDFPPRMTHVLFICCDTCYDTQGILSSAPLSLPGRDPLNLAMVGGILAGGVALAVSGDMSGMLPALGAGSVVAAVFGAHATASIGGVC